MQILPIDQLVEREAYCSKRETSQTKSAYSSAVEREAYFDKRKVLRVKSAYSSVVEREAYTFVAPGSNPGGRTLDRIFERRCNTWYTFVVIGSSPIGRT